ncbi:MAG: glycosyltransferase [Rufibacter sp.]
MMFSIGFLVLYFSLFLVLLGFWWCRKQPHLPMAQYFPKVSILIAARNEEQNILRCLSAIARLNYPKEKIEVLVGDDRSTDKTKEYILGFQQEHPYVICIPINVDLPSTKGKANVLAQLARQATSDFFFITDADIEVPPNWLQRLLGAMVLTTGIVTGITTTKGSRWFDRMQALDWLYNLGLMQVVADRGVPVSTMGNNMLVTRQAYVAVGGFEGIPFSITEDVQLHKHVLANGFTTQHVYHPEALALSEPVPDFASFLRQRRRWMRGSLHLPWYMVLLFVVHSAYYLVWLPFFLHTSWVVWGGVFCVKLGLQSLFVWQCVRLAQWPFKWKDILLLEGYLLLTNFILLLYFFLPLKISWKGREY